MVPRHSILIYLASLSISVVLLSLSDTSRIAVVNTFRTNVYAVSQWLFSSFIDRTNIIEKNRLLSNQLINTTLDNFELREYKLENIRLRNLLAFTASSTYTQPLAAEIIGRDPDQIYDTITIDIGNTDGVQIGSIVVTADGLVGVVSSVNTSTSIIKLITRSRISAIVQDSRAQGIVTWTKGRQFKLKFVDAVTEVHKSQRVITSGLGGIFPKGLLIGIIQSVKPDLSSSVFQEVHLQSSVNFASLEEVFVIMPQPLDF